MCAAISPVLDKGRFRRSTWGRTLRVIAALTSIACGQAGLVAPALAGEASVVQTTSGQVRGIDDERGRRFLGIPYAKAPVGELRWSNPQPPQSWKGIRAATQFGNVCAQVKELGDFANASTDEDCLYLNVYVPDGAAKRPVMLWIHGGATTGMSDSYDGSVLAREQNVVVVTINYRMGALGGLVHSALDAGGSSTLYGLRDEQFAMQWVQRNITQFGGDPGNVTLFGESTGATDVLLHLVSPAAKGLFHRAILQSPARYFNPLVSLADAEKLGSDFAARAGCPSQSAECLRKLPVQALLKAQGSFGTNCCAVLPVNDGHILTRSIQDAVRSGHFNQVPVLVMTDRDEDRWFQAFFGELAGQAVLSAADYPAQLKTLYPDIAPALEKAYPLNRYGSTAEALAAVSSDRGAICQPRSFSIDASKYVTSYAAEFNDPHSPGILPAVSFPLGASHTHELQYIFPGWKGVYQGDVRAFTPEQATLAKDMRTLWATFAATGELPGEFGNITRTRDQVISLRPTGLKMIDDFSQVHNCDFWNTVRHWTPVQ